MLLYTEGTKIRNKTKMYPKFQNAAVLHFEIGGTFWSYSLFFVFNNNSKKQPLDRSNVFLGINS